MRLRARVDCAAHLGHPEADAVVHEHGEGEPELVAVEGSLWLADDDGIEATGGVLEGGEQAGRLGAALPGQRPGLAHVEELGNDLAADGLDDLAGRSELPPPRGLGVLPVLGRDPSVEGEAHGQEATASEAGAAGPSAAAFSRTRSRTRHSPGASRGLASGSTIARRSGNSSPAIRN